MIDLRSDTVTKPTQPMLEAMSNASVGDDVFGDDPTVNQFQERIAKLFGKEAALFCPSGTMTNQISIKVHTQPGHEIICDQEAHVYRYEGGGIAFNSGASVRPVNGRRGLFTADQVKTAINPKDIHKPLSKLVVIENTCNHGGGSIWPLDQMKAIRAFCDQHNLQLHLDGARLFNALVETGEQPDEVGPLFDSISICFSKGLGIPAGSVIIGSEDFIQQSLRIRKVMGGGLRQAGYMAAAAEYALDHHVERLKEDHNQAQKLTSHLQSLPFVKQVLPAQTNIVVFELAQDADVPDFLARLKDQGVLAVPFGGQWVRMVTHLDITDEMLNETLEVLEKMDYQALSF
ncbi:MAG: threonine aldolase [Bacteroidetes bacterium SW_10_40_5]|nr:MAG: threonine aldolase [Bacteroidetes bacterium SW_10_40_5]